MATIFDNHNRALSQLQTQGSDSLLRGSTPSQGVGVYKIDLMGGSQSQPATWDQITAKKAAEQREPGTKSNTPSQPISDIERLRAQNLAKPLSPLQQGTLPDRTVTNVVVGREVSFQKNYPLDLPMGENSYYLQIMLGPYDVNTALQGHGVQHDVSIALPVPANLLTATALDYTNINLGAFGGEFLKSALRLGEAAENGDFFAQLRSEVNTGVRAVFDRNDGSVRQLIARRLVSGLSPALGSAVDLASGSTPNPHVAVTFNNVKLRSFTYTWRFSPNKKEESAVLQEIIQKLHQRILPKRKGNLLLEYPNQCQLQLLPQQLNELFKFKPCVIDAMNVNYAPSGTPSFFADTKLPTEIELSLTFHEIQLRTAEDYGAGA